MDTEMLDIIINTTLESVQYEQDRCMRQYQLGMAIGAIFMAREAGMIEHDTFCFLQDTVNAWFVSQLIGRAA